MSGTGSVTNLPGLQAIVGGLGISVLSRHTLALDAAMGQLTTLDVSHFPIKRQWYAVYPAGKQPTIVAQTFLEYLRSATDWVKDIPCHFAEQAGECPLISMPSGINRGPGSGKVN